jgi:hypothetical protein
LPACLANFILIQPADFHGQPLFGGLRGQHIPKGLQQVSDLKRFANIKLRISGELMAAITISSL